MQKDTLLKLKSGTDVRGVASDGFGQEVTLTDEAVDLICRAFAEWLLPRAGKARLKIALGHDPRLSSPRIEQTAINALNSCGCDVLKCGLCSTPSMFMILQNRDYGCDGSVMITASHLPRERNGLKFFTPRGGLDGKDIVEILNIAADENFTIGNGKTSECNFLREYCDDLVKKVRAATGRQQPLSGKKIIVDAGNGAGGFYCDLVLKPLGANTEGSQFLQPDGNFPNHIPNPEDKTAIDSLKKAVLNNCADFGIIFDTDVDRAACVDSDGEEINRNRLIALISAILIKEKAGVIVTDSVTSDHLTEFIESLGGRHLRYKRGYKNVIDKCIELNNSGAYSPLAIETSGHAALKENYFLDDGAYLITRLLITLASLPERGKISDLITGLKLPKEEKEVRIAFNDKSVDFKSEGLKVIETVRTDAPLLCGVSAADDDYEGVRLRFDGGHGCGWLLVRQSVHDPVIPINFESDITGGVSLMAKTLHTMLLKFEFLNIEKLTELF